MLLQQKFKLCYISSFDGLKEKSCLRCYRSFHWLLPHTNVQCPVSGNLWGSIIENIVNGDKDKDKNKDKDTDVHCTMPVSGNFVTKALWGSIIVLNIIYH